MTSSLIIVFYGFVFFCFAFILHLGIWRVRLPRHQTDALLKIFAIVLVLGIFLMRCFLEREVFSLFDYLRLSLLYISLSLAYTISYSAVEAGSPSLLITLKIADSKTGGFEKKKLETLLTNESLLLPRLSDLTKDGLVVYKDGTYRLTPKGAVFIKIFIFFRKLLGAPKGG